MKIKDYLKTVDKQLKNVKPEEKKRILNHLQKTLKKFLKKSQEDVIVEKLGDPVKYGKALNRHCRLLKTTDNIRLTLQPTISNNGNKNGKKNFLKYMKFIISADMIMPFPTHDLWLVAGASIFLIFIFSYALYLWQMLAFVWILAPAFIGNSAALLSRRIKILDSLAIPMDLGKKWRDGRRVIGNSKTIRGFIFGTSASVASAAVIFYASTYFGINVFNSLEYALLIGTFLGFGALLGDIVKSFFKRRIGLVEGENLIFFDQMDFLIGAILFSLPLVDFPARFILIMFAATFVLHIITNVLAFYLRIKKVPW